MPETAEALRNFNRFYTRRIGVLDRSYLKSRFSLPEARLLYELAQKPGQPSVIADGLDMDRGFVSRIMQRFQRDGLVRIAKGEPDRRSQTVSLTIKGRIAFRDIDLSAARLAAKLVDTLPPGDRAALTASLSAARLYLGDGNLGDPVLRHLQTGDIGWITMRQGQVYTAEYGWDGSYEALVAEILGRFASAFKPGREQAWIAEQSAMITGSVFLVEEDAITARLRLLFVEPAARGHGLGRNLIRSCTEFAKDSSYSRIVLWTQSMLGAARHLYQSEGYRMIASEPHHSFGHDLVGETWELRLDGNH
jgi:DNA-binding MarR family transcriptional regulator/GNAT superfamily N-acetyltransferase